MNKSADIEAAGPPPCQPYPHYDPYHPQYFGQPYGWSYYQSPLPVAETNICHRYEDIILRPKFTNCRSRKDLPTEVQFGSHTFKLPIIPANMAAVISGELARWMARNHYFYIMHRFGDTRQFVRLLRERESSSIISISVGVKDEDRQLLKDLVDAKPDYITIDIAHGHCLAMKEMIEYIKGLLPDSFIIAGNVSTADAVADLAFWGASAAKAGIAQGGACTTYGKTGFGGSMFSCVVECAKEATIPIIADGGTKTNGDIPKALVAGAKMVMCGSLFAACTNSPAEDIRKNDVWFKRYFGSASKSNKSDWRHIEGQIVDIPCNLMSYEEKLAELEADLQSAMSYGGCQNLDDFKNVEWSVVY